MSVPSLKAGKHNLTLKLDTKSLLGVLFAEREVYIEDGKMEEVAAAYMVAKQYGDAAKASKLRQELLTTRFTNKIAPGQEVPIDKLFESRSEATGFSAKIKWMPEKDHINAELDIVDPNALTDSSGAVMSEVYLLFAPNGLDKGVSAVHICPGIDGENALVELASVAEPEKSSSNTAAKATWKSVDGGYRVNVSVPLTALKDYQPGWSLMPVEAVVVKRSDEWRAYRTSGYDSPFMSVRSYSVLTAK